MSCRHHGSVATGMPYHTAVFTSNAKLTFSAILVSFSEFKGIGSVTGISPLGNIFGPSKAMSLAAATTNAMGPS
jgi:hypothetical protein